jgi:paraquat-inducible protein B
LDVKVVFKGMKKKTINKLIQKPLRFHHQDIHEELDSIKIELAEIRRLLENVNSEMPRLQQRDNQHE